jgi:hypothetical protein
MKKPLTYLLKLELINAPSKGWAWRLAIAKVADQP